MFSAYIFKPLHMSLSNQWKRTTGHNVVNQIVIQCMYFAMDSNSQTRGLWTNALPSKISGCKLVYRWRKGFQQKLTQKSNLPQNTILPKSHQSQMNLTHRNEQNKREDFNAISRNVPLLNNLYKVPSCTNKYQIYKWFKLLLLKGLLAHPNTSGETKKMDAKFKYSMTMNENIICRKDSLNE